MFQSIKMIGFILTKDYQKAREFYEHRLGCTFVSQDQFALVMQAGENHIRIAKVAQFAPQQGTVLGWEVRDIRSVVAELTKCGVTFEKYPFVQDQVTGIWVAPGGDQVAWFKDPDGNVLSVSQHVA